MLRMLPFLQAARQRPAPGMSALRKTLLRPWMLNSGLAIAASFLALLALETYLYAGLAFPRLLGTRLYTTDTRNFLRDYYMGSDRNIIQALPQCAVYNAQLLYILRSGGCNFSNREFATWLSVNAMGFRQTTQMDGPPRIAVLGDSHAMGWGVEDHETFASLIEQSLGEKVANLSVSSYGTAREFIALSRSKLKSVRTIIIAYSYGDAKENRDYLLHGTRQADIDKFRFLQDQQREPYRPFRLLESLVHGAPENMRVREEGAPGKEYLLRDLREEAATFIALLRRFEKELNNKTIIVLEVNGYNQNSPRFIQQVCTEFERVKKSGSDVRFSLHTVDVSEILSERSYFVLDDHINAIGHSQVARLLVETIRRLRSKVPSRGTLKS